jgi:Domain of unknown function (DUF4180)
MFSASEHPKAIRAADLGLVIAAMTDVADAVGASFGSAGLLLTEHELRPAFFDLRSGIAGELFQKFTNYGLRLALVVPDAAIHGERISELIFEHRQHKLIRFFTLEMDALGWLETSL